MIFQAFSIVPYDSIRTDRTNEGVFVIHQIEEGETLYSLARRYKSTVPEIVKTNQIVDNKIGISQIIRVPITFQEKTITSDTPKKAQITSATHIVKEGETLYSISRKYGMSVQQLQQLNNLSSNTISLGMELKVNQADQFVTKTTSADKSKKDSKFKQYVVLSGENLKDVAKKLKVPLDSLKKWNDLKRNKLKKGQKILYLEAKKAKTKKEDKVIKVAETSEGKPYEVIDQDGFKRTLQEGIVSVIPSMETKKFLALHRDLPIGTQLKVKNLMNNRSVYVKVVGRLPNTGENEKLLLRISQIAYDKLGILDLKSRVEVSYLK